MPRTAKWPFVEQTTNGWRASVRDGERRFKGQVRETPELAHADAMRLLRDRTNGVAPTASMTISEALAGILRDLDRRERRDATGEFYKSHLGAAVSHFGSDKRLSTITVEDVQGFIDNRRDSVGGQTIKHDLMALTRAMRLAKVDPIPTRSPDLVRPRIQKRDASLRLAWSEVQDALRKLEGNDYAVLAFVAGTGVRRTEFARMRAADIDLAGDRLVIPIGKTNPRELPLPKAQSAWQACETLLGLNYGGAYLLPGDTEKQRVRFLQETVVRARALTGQKRLQLHELRRAFASRIAERFPVPVVSALLGHALPGTTGLYVHADRLTLRKAMDDIWGDFRVEKIKRRKQA